jgi:hypothetical protein
VSSPGSRETGDVELLLDRYAAEGLAPHREELERARAAMFARWTDAGSMAPLPRRSLLRGWSLAGAAAMLVIAGAGLAAAESGPGQPLYGLRLAIGIVTLPVEEPAHQRGLADQLEDRLSEVGAAARTGDLLGAQAAIDEYLHTLRELSRDGVTDPAILALLQRHRTTLQELLAVAPAQAADGVQQAIEDAGKVNGVAPPTESAVPHPTPAHDAGQPPATGKP